MLQKNILWKNKQNAFKSEVTVTLLIPFQNVSLLAEENVVDKNYKCKRLITQSFFNR